MTKLNLFAAVLVLMFGLTVFGISNARAGDNTEIATAGAGGFDVVSYFTELKPMRGSGRHTAEYQGVTYLFSSEQNKNTFGLCL